MSRILITGAAGFIGSHLGQRLRDEGHFVTGVDIVDPEFGKPTAHEFFKTDLRDLSSFRLLGLHTFDEVYHLAADMGGIGYITANAADIAINNTRINSNLLVVLNEVQGPRPKLLFSSSACIYPQGRQAYSDILGLKEEDAYPAEPERGYGWEKLYMEQLCQYFRDDKGFDVRMVRFHNVYGPVTTWTGGKEKSPAAACRKIAELPDEGGEVEIWGDGKQTRSYMFIDDCLEGLVRLMASDWNKPLNLGRDEMVSIDELFDTVAAVAGKTLTKRYNLNAPQGVRGRNSDNALLRTVLGWEPEYDLKRGLSLTYPWILEQVRASRNGQRKS